MKNIFKLGIFSKTKTFIVKHKIWSSLILVLFLIIIYFIYKKTTSISESVRYIPVAVKRGDLVSTISGSGQVASYNQIDIKARASGDVTYISVVNGQNVNSGALIATLDDSDALKNVRDAEVSLENARISIEKLKGPVGISVPRNKQNAEEDLSRSYEDGFSDVSNTFLTLPGVMTGLQTILYDDNFMKGQDNIAYYNDAIREYDENSYIYKDDASSKYKIAREKYDSIFDIYKSTSRYASTSTIEKLISDTYEMTKDISESVKSVNNLLQFHKDKLSEHNIKVHSLVDTYLSNLNTYTSTTNNQLSALLDVKNSIKNSKDALLNSDLDIRSEELSLKQKEIALLDAKEKLADYYIRAPFGGTIAKVNIKKTDSVSSGTSVATLITKEKIAEISLNEVDVSKIKVGDKAELTFDAIDGLKVTGEVSEIDNLGTVSQGVVVYDVKINFSTDNNKIKSGMSVSTVITTDTKTNVLLVPVSAIKTNPDETNYVEIFKTADSKSKLTKEEIANLKPVRQSVIVGASNDTYTEIISGLEEGDRVVSRTVTTSTKTTANSTSAPSLFGGSRSATGAVRINR
jgi:HlyD family secretion protein